MATETRPKLRAVEARPFEQNGRAYLLLRDPLALSDQTVVVPQELQPLLALCDGTRDVDTLAAAAAIRFGIRLRSDTIRQAIETLDAALMLENERFAEARAAALEAYRHAPCRRPALAGGSYPADPGELRAFLNGFTEALEDAEPPAAPTVRGLVSPHIDFQRGGTVYARTWMRAGPMVRQADLAVILGTDHSGSDGTLTLTRQNYATPFGVLPTPGAIVDRVAAAMGEEAAFAAELHHRGEHSVELAAVWFHFVRGGTPCELLPILCGPLPGLSGSGGPAVEDAAVSAAVEALREAVQGRRAVVIAAGDLSHVGPAFGGPRLDLAARARIQSADAELIERVCAGDATGFVEAVQRVGNRNNVCGVAPIYLALRLLGETSGQAVAYAVCPADERGASAVSICGVILE